MSETSALDAADLVSKPLAGAAEVSDASSKALVGQTEPHAYPGIFLRVRADLEALAAEWKAFESEADCTAFQCFDWATKWQRHIGSQKGTRPAIVTGRDAGGKLLFIFPLAVERRLLARRLTWLGSELCDYNGPLLSPRFAERIRADRFALLWSEIGALIRADPRLRFDLVDLPKMPKTVGGQANPFMALDPVLDASGAHLANLGTSWDAFYAGKRSPATRKRERRQLRHLAEFGEVRFVEPRERRDIALTLETLFFQKAASFARMGVENFLARPGYREFFRDIATDRGAKVLTHVSRLDVASTMAATNFGLQFRGRYYLLLSSYQEGELARFGPGRAHLYELMRRAIEKGLLQFDFTVGDEPYKRDWSDVMVPLYGHFAAKTLRGWPVVMATRAFRRAKRAIKQNPPLWHIFNAMRRRIAAIGHRRVLREDASAAPPT